MTKRAFFLGCLIILLSSFFIFAFTSFVDAATPVISTITPNTGSSATSTQVTINGSSFQPTPTVSIYGGGPYIKGSCDTPDEAL